MLLRRYGHIFCVARYCELLDVYSQQYLMCTERDALRFTRLVVWKLREGAEGDTHLVCRSEVPQLGIVIVPLGRRSGVSLSLWSSNPRTFKPTLVELLLSLNTCPRPA